MKPLAFNMRMSQYLSARYQFGLSALPLAFMLVPMIALIPFALWLNAYLGIPEDAPVRDHPNGTYWIVIFLGGMLLVMLLGYLLGWVINAAIARFFLGWTSAKTRAVFLDSEVPREWLKTGVTTESIAADEREVRKTGQWFFILTRGVFGWGAAMYCLMAVLPVFKGDRSGSMAYFLTQGAIWAVAGAVFGLFMWHSVGKYKTQKRDE